MRFIATILTALFLIPAADACKQSTSHRERHSVASKRDNRHDRHHRDRVRHKSVTRSTVNATTEAMPMPAPEVRQEAKPAAQAPAAPMPNPPQYREMSVLSSNGRFRRATYKTVLVPVNLPQRMPAANPKVEVPVEKLAKVTPTV